MDLFALVARRTDDSFLNHVDVTALGCEFAQEEKDSCIVFIYVYL